MTTTNPQVAQLVSLSSIIFETLCESKVTKDNPIALSTIYLALDTNYELHEYICTILSRMGWIEYTSERIWVTESGFKAYQERLENIKKKGAKS